MGIHKKKMAEKYRNLSNETRLELFQYLLARSTNDSLPKGTMKLAMEKFSCSRSTISRIWKRGITKAEGSTGYNCVDSQRKNKCGTKKKYSAEMVQEAIKNVPEDKRTSLRDIANYTGISKSTCHRFLKLGHLQAHSSTVDLSKEHKKLTKNAPDVHVFFTQDVHAERKPKGARYASKCNFCFNHTSSNAIRRLEMHLRNCTHAPDDIKKQYPHPNTRIKVINYSSVLSTDSKVTPTQLKKHRKATVIKSKSAVNCNKDDYQLSVSNALSNFWYAHALPFKALGSPEFFTLMNTSFPSFEPNNAKQIIKSQLDQVYSNLKNSVQKEIKEADHITLFSFGWSTAYSDDFINYLVCFKDKKVLLYRSDFLLHRAITSELIASHIENVVVEIGIDKVVSIVTDYAPNMKSAFRIIESRLPGVICNGFAAQTMDLLIKDILNMSLFEKVVEDAVFISIFIHSEYILKKNFMNMNEQSQKSCNMVPKHKIEIPEENRWFTYHTLLEDLVENKIYLTELCNSEYSNVMQQCQQDRRSCTKLNRFKDLIFNNEFWESLLKLYAILQPVMKLVSSFLRNSCCLGDVFSETKALLQRICDDTDLYKLYCEKWHFLCTDSMSWAYVLNPCSNSKVDEQKKENINCINSLNNYLLLLEARHDGNCSDLKKMEVTNELEKFLSDSTTVAQNYTNPLQFWSTFGRQHYPHIYEIALRVYNVPTSNYLLERASTAFKSVQFTFCHHRDKESLAKMIFIFLSKNLHDQVENGDSSSDNSSMKNPITVLL